MWYAQQFHMCTKIIYVSECVYRDVICVPQQDNSSSDACLCVFLSLCECERVSYVDDVENLLEKNTEHKQKLV